MQIEVLDSQKLLGERLQDHYRAKYGSHAAKRVAAVTGSDIRTAQGLISEGREPRGKALLAIFRDLGRDALLAILSPEIEQHDERLERELHDLREKTARLEARLGKGGVPSADRMDRLAPAGTRKGRVNQNPVRRVRPRSGRAHRRPGNDR